ncbi:hypothetical protein [Oceanobacter mangrovi]|uniref:hypothetical protein n=1 Tax=Oceanobacter mangrovi TaxID=2862510 RepID=UPI001C8DBB68|nr:hypothetical protein [Oceanobacter mangrovi]
MLKSTVMTVRNLTSLLLEYPLLVRQLETKSPSFLANLFDWLERTEQALLQHSNVLAAELAGIKSRIIAPACKDDLRGSVRKVQIRTAADHMFELQDCLQRALQPHARKLDESREPVRQLLAIVADSGAVSYDGNTSLDQLISRIWYLMSHHEQLKPLMVQLKSRLSEQDVKLLLADEIELEDFTDQPVSTV